MPEAGFDTLRGYGELRGKREPLPAKQAKAEAAAEKLREADELNDDEAERLEALEAEIETLSEGYPGHRVVRVIAPAVNHGVG
jgi:hypothetical protein